MRRTGILLSAACAALVALLVAACNSPLSSSPTAKRGSLTIAVANKINARTLAPTIDMNAAGYTVTGTGPDSATFTQTTTGPSVTANNLAFGSWTIVVNATNAGGTLIGTGTATTQIDTGQTTSVSVSVTPVAGAGTLSLDVSWPSGKVETPSINASLTPALGSAQTLPFVISGAAASYTNAAVGNGYYTLAFTLQDNAIIVAGAVEVVRIVAGQTTNGTYAFSNVNAPGGTIQVNVNANMQSPLLVTISGAQATQSAGSTQSLTASASNYSGNLVYVWYVNGVSAATGPSFAFGSGVSAGYYRIDVTAFTADGTQAGSTTAQVQVTAAIGGSGLNLSGVVTTLAGSTAFGHADGAGTAATFNHPYGITTDGLNLYIADLGNNEIRKIVIATGIVTTLAGSTTSGAADGMGAAAGFNAPWGITTDGINLYVTDEVNNEIRKIVISTGSVTTIAGSTMPGSADGTGTAASFNGPSGITTDGTSLYVSDFGNNEIRKVVIATGVVTTLAGSTLTGNLDGIGMAARFYYPHGIAISGPNLYVADQMNGSIRQIVIATGAVSTLPNVSLLYPYGVVAAGGSLYVASSGNQRIVKIALGSDVQTTTAGSGATGSSDGIGSVASFNWPDGITTDGSNLYVADVLNNEIRKIQ